MSVAADFDANTAGWDAEQLSSSDDDGAAAAASGATTSAAGMPGSSTDALYSGLAADDDLYGGLVRYLRDELMVDFRIARLEEEPSALRRFDPERRILTLSEMLPPRSRNFQLAVQIALITLSDTIDSILRRSSLSTMDSKNLARVALANYFAGAVLMPYRPFLAAAREERSAGALKELMVREISRFTPNIEAVVTNLRRLTVVVGASFHHHAPLRSIVIIINQVVRDPSGVADTTTSHHKSDRALFFQQQSRCGQHRRKAMPVPHIT